MKITTNSGVFDLISVNTYNTWLNPEELFYLEEYENTDEVYAGFQWNVYGSKLAEQLESYYEDELLPILAKIGVSHIKVWDFRSPKEYNFYGDTVAIEFTYGRYTMSKLRKYLMEHIDDLRDYLKENFSSHSGFYSYVIYDNVNKFISTVGDSKLSTAIALMYFAKNDDSFDIRQEKYEELCSGNITFYDCLNVESMNLVNKLYQEHEEVA
jgi:hypothetical protein